MRLDEAADIRLGERAVSRVMLGEAQVCAGVGEGAARRVAGSHLAAEGGGLDGLRERAVERGVEGRITLREFMSNQ